MNSITKRIGRRYKPLEFEPKWEKIWEEKKTFKVDIEKAKKPFYNLAMFPYPSGEGLHVGHIIPYSGADTFGRFMWMKGFDVFEPMGFDAFGIHAENFAIKKGIHPAKLTAQTTKYFRDEQMKKLGTLFDWERMVDTSNPDYYKWTQWLFVKMFKAGLAVRKKAMVNWCQSCKTVLSDEQVINQVQSAKCKVQSQVKSSNDVCERCKTEVEKREMEQWFFKITNYAERLLENTYKINWSKKTLAAQRNWIGKSEGIDITYKMKELSETITCFTTTPVNFGATFIVVAPEYELVNKILDRKIKVTEDRCKEIKAYVEKASKKTEQERIAEGKDKTGVFTGLYAINHVTGEEIPVWVSDFVLVTVGTGAVQGCPGHDKRDFYFAKKFGIPIPRVVTGPLGESGPIENEEDVVGKGSKGKMINSDFLNGMEFSEAMQKTMDYFVEKGWGKRVIHYKLRDWCISRQRYWGPPIPMIHCQACADKEINYFNNKKNVLILHGTWGSGEGNWFPWLKNILKKQNIDVANPTLPDSRNPDYKTRMEFIETNYKDYLSKDSIIIGHSSGASTALHLAMKYKLKKVILVAPVLYVDKGYKKILEKAFNKETADRLGIIVNRKVDFELIKQNIGQMIILFGRKDPYIPKEFINYAKDKFGEAMIEVLSGYGHFSTDTNDPKEFSEVLNYIRDEADVDNRMLGWFPVPEEELPVLLPETNDYLPDGSGKSPLAKIPSFVKTKCPYCGGEADRETDVSDTFLDSSWYFLRYPSVGEDVKIRHSGERSDSRIKITDDSGRASQSEACQNDELLPFDPEITKKWLPVDMYIGGNEHAVLHLMYARFVTMALYDMGQLPFEEPFTRFFAHGLLIKDGAKMSKSRGNVVNPNVYLNKYGADVLRMYILFLGPYDGGGDFRDTGIEGMWRFLNRVYRFVIQEISTYKSYFDNKEVQSAKCKVQSQDEETIDNSAKQNDLWRKMQKLIKGVGEDLGNLKFNTAIAKMMEFLNLVQSAKCKVQSQAQSLKILQDYILLLAPLAPHLSEELHQELRGARGESGFESVHDEPWPLFDEKALVTETVTIIIQVNGKVRGKMAVPSKDLEARNAEEEIVMMAKKEEKVKKYLEGKKIVKTVYVPFKLVNFAV